MQGRERLSTATLGRLEGAAPPGYDRRSVGVGIVHLGVGAFHRAHQAVYLDDRIAAGETGWGILGASLRSPATRDALAPQDGLYTVASQEPAGERLRVVGSIVGLAVAPEDPAGLVARMADPAVRIVTLTVTEKAYLRAPDGGLDLSHPDVVHDLAHPARPRTVHGFLAAALERRRAAGVPPFTVLCCDNLPANGATVRRLLGAFADALGGAIADHVARDVAFPSTMVDRIVPATTDEDRRRVAERIGLEDAWPVKAEPFMQWVVEDRFTLGRPRLEEAGVEMVPDVRPFEEMKLRLLNGAHSGIAYLGLLAGLPTVSEAFADPAVRGLVDRLWGEAATTLPGDAGLDPDAYVRALATRFANTALVHRTAQIAMDGSNKMPQRIMESARARVASGRPADALMLVPAAWIACCEARGRSLPAGHFTDPLDEDMAAIFARAPSARDTVAAVFRRAGFGADDVATRLEEVAAAHLQTIRERGVRAAVAATEGRS